MSEQPASQKEKTLTVEEAIADLKGDDSGAQYYAAWWLGRFRVRDQNAIQALIDALEDEKDRSPDGGYPLRRNAARALGKLGDPQAVAGLIKSLGCSDYYVREAAAQSLGMIGDDEAIAPLMKLIEGGIEAANPIPGCPHLAEPFDSIIEALGMLNAKEALRLIEPFQEHAIALVQYSCARAMYQLTGDPTYGDRLVEALEGDKLQLRRSALSDLGAIGYLPAAPAIAETLAENSLKLISLKGVLETELNQNGQTGLSDAAIEVMKLMDSLL